MKHWLHNSCPDLVGTIAGANIFMYAYDGIGNHVLHGVNLVTNRMKYDALNQRVSVLVASAPPREMSYTADGGLSNDGRFAYAYDAEDRLVSATSLAPTNGAVRVRNEYDWRSRRVAKCVDRYDAGADSWRLVERHDFVWDNWNIVHETVSTFAGAATNVTEVQYFWGPDLSGTLDGAGGVGGLLAVSFNGSFYFPVYDNNGNVMKYVDESGAIVAAYVYDDFGKIVLKIGTLADTFSFRFSTKYFDRETNLIAYQLRYYKPEDRGWISRDPIEEEGGENLAVFCRNAPMLFVDGLGKKDAPVNPFFMGPKSEKAIRSYVDVRIERLRSYLPDAELDRVSFVARFSPPKPIVVVVFSNDEGINALGGYNDMFVPRKGRDIGDDFWGAPQLVKESPTLAGYIMYRVYEYVQKKFTFGYFVYVANDEQSEFHLK